MEKKYNWINTDVKIDFPLPHALQVLVNEIEQMDQNEDWCYFDRCEFIENFTKEYVYEGILTSKQRDLLCKRYSG